MTKKYPKRVVSLLLTVLLLVGLVPVGGVTASATDDVKVTYLDENGDKLVCVNPTIVESGTEDVTWSDGWYVVGKDYNGDGVINYDDGNYGETTFTVEGTVTLSGSVNIILADGFTFYAVNDAEDGYAVKDSDEVNVTFYSQSNGMYRGYFNACADKGYGLYLAGDSVTVNGGDVYATGGDFNKAAITCGTLTVNNGYVTGASVTNDDETCSTGGKGISVNTLLMNGGSVYAKGGDGTLSDAGHACGGNGMVAYHITVNDGWLTSYGGQFDRYQSTDPDVLAYYLSNGASSGVGILMPYGDITVNGGNVSISGGYYRKSFWSPNFAGVDIYVNGINTLEIADDFDTEPFELAHTDSVNLRDTVKDVYYFSVSSPFIDEVTVTPANVNTGISRISAEPMAFKGDTLTYTYEVKNPDGEPVTVTGDTFIPATDGDYQVKATVTSELGERAEYKFYVFVSSIQYEFERVTSTTTAITVTKKLDSNRAADLVETRNGWSWHHGMCVIYASDTDSDTGTVTYDGVYYYDNGSFYSLTNYSGTLDEIKTAITEQNAEFYVFGTTVDTPLIGSEETKIQWQGGDSTCGLVNLGLTGTFEHIPLEFEEGSDTQLKNITAVGFLVCKGTQAADYETVRQNGIPVPTFSVYDNDFGFKFRVVIGGDTLTYDNGSVISAIPYVTVDDVTYYGTVITACANDLYEAASTRAVNPLPVFNG